MTTNTDPVRAQDYVAVPRAFLEQVYAMAREGCEAPATAYRWCERIDGLFHGGSLDEHDEWARQLPAALASAPPSAPVGVDIEAMEGAAKFLAGRFGEHDGWAKSIRDAIAILSQQPAAPSGEAVAWPHYAGSVLTSGADNEASVSFAFSSRDEAERFHEAAIAMLAAAPQQPAGVDEAAAVLADLHPFLFGLKLAAPNEEKRAFIQERIDAVRRASAALAAQQQGGRTDG